MAPTNRFRIFFFAFLILLFLALVAYRLVHLQIVGGERYRLFSEANSFREVALPATRGRIFDRNGKILADNRPNFVLTLNLAEVKDLDGTVATLSYLLETDSESVRADIGKRRTLSPWIPLLVVGDLDESRVARIRARMSQVKVGEQADSLHGIELTVRFERIYPFHEKLSHVLGYVKEVGEKDLQKWNATEPGRVSPGDAIGVAGVEKAFDERLRGYDGYRQIIVDAKGNEADLAALGIEKTLGARSARGGESLELSLDAGLNQAAYDAMAGRPGAVVAIDPRSGEILVWVSTPAYDPEDLSGAISTAKWAELRDHPEKILLNRPIQAAYPPGSTHKILTALAALGSGKTDLKETVNCPGYYQQGDRRWGCWNLKGHGKVDLKKAITVSCDVYFYKIGERLGPDPIAFLANLLGMGEKTGVLADAERSGLVPTVAWKEKNKHEDWMASDSLGGAIGQGYNLITPLQNALMIAQFANGGKKISPHLVRAGYNEKGERKPEPVAPRAALPLKVSQQQYAAVRQALVAVVNEPGGTGTKAKLPGVRVAGKTGTAQVISHEGKRKAGKGVNTENHAWFVAFAPEENPEIALAVIVEHGGGGGAVAAPVAKKVLEKYFEQVSSPSPQPSPSD